jgi:hypothetical protein
MLQFVPRHLRPRREKVFGDGPRIPLDREAKVRIMHLARALKHRTEPRKHYGALTGKFVDVLHALLWLIHDGKSGQCNPAYATIAGRAGCVPSTVGEAIKALESVGILSWVNRIHRTRFRERDLFGHWTTVWRVLRTSNAYVFHDPKMAAQQGRPSNTEIRCEPLDAYKKQRSGARCSARVMQEELPMALPVPFDRPPIARQREHGSGAGANLSPAEHAALIARLDTKPTKDDWVRYNAWLESRIAF